MDILYIIAIAVIIFAVIMHDSISYEKYYKRCEISAKHPDWEPYCGIDFIDKDPQWFIDNGYSEYVNKKKAKHSS